MDFGFDEEQRRFAASVRAVVEGRYPTTWVREMLDDPRGFSAAFWADAGALGWLGVLVDERFGGMGRGPLELVAVQQELGRGVVPGPYLSSAVLATAAIAFGGSEAQQAHWLPRLAAGDVIGTVAFQEARGGWDTRGVALAATPAAGDGFRLDGEKWFVPDAHVADVVVVPTRTSDGVTLFLVETGSRGVSVRRMDTIDPTRRLSVLALDGVRVGADAILGGGWPVLERVADLGRVALAAEMVGGAERALEMCTDYARVRQQFGKPIGSFQAIQHKCADMMVAVEGARAMTFAAATSLADGDPDATVDASIAKAWCSDAYRTVTTEGVQIHGAIGFTWDLDMQLFYKRAKADEVLLGDARFQRARVAERVL